MSLVSAYLKIGSIFYKNPIYKGAGWFVCFDDEDPPELVIKDSCGLRPTEIFEMRGIKATEIRLAHRANRWFDRVFCPATSYWFKILAPIPVPDGYEGICGGIQEGVYYEGGE